MLKTKQNNYPASRGMHLRVAYTGTSATKKMIDQLPNEFQINRINSLQELQEYLNNQSILTLPDVMIIETDPDEACFSFIERIKKNPLWRELIIVLIGSEEHQGWKEKALKLKVHDYYFMPFPIEHLTERLSFLVKFKLIKPSSPIS